MKTKHSLLYLVSFVFCLSLCPSPCALSQIPQGFNYQAIARDGSGSILPNTPLQAMMYVQSLSTGGTIFWKELHSTITTNDFGLFTLVIGTGTRQIESTVATFDLIDWSVTPKYLKTEIYYDGSWKDMGVSQFMSVPYALRAKDSDQWQVNGADIYRLTGKVGIGTSTPLVPLSVYNPGSNTTIHIGGTTAGQTYLSAGTSASTNGYSYLQSIKTAGTAYGDLIINNVGGNVGIGTITPTALLNPYKTIGDGFNNTSEIMNLTIKPTSSTHLLRFYGIRKVAGTSWNDVSLRIQQRVDATDMGYIEFNPGSASQDLAFGTSNTERLRIGAAGNVGIGTSSPLYLLDVNGSGRFSNSVLIGNSSGPITANWWEFGVDNGGGTGIDFHANSSANDFSARIYREGGNNGNFYIWNTGTGILQLGPPGAPVNINSSGNVGIGTTTQTSKVVIRGPDSWDDSTPLFEVKNKTGVPIFAVYNNGVRILVDNTNSKAIKGGFAVGGYDMTKAGKTVDFMTISPDSIRFNINNDNVGKGLKGGFAVGGYDLTKGPINQDFMYITPESGTDRGYNTFMGYLAGKANTTGYSNVFIGRNAGTNNQDGYYNVSIGHSAGAGLVSGYACTFVGAGSGLSNTAIQNSFFGCFSGNQTTTGADNTFLGGYTGFGNVSGKENVYVGRSAGDNTLGESSANVYLGFEAGKNSDGSNNVFIGYRAGIDASESNKLAITGSSTNSNLITGDFSNKYVVIAGIANNGYTFFVNGTSAGWSAWTNLSDSRYKKDIFTISDALMKVKQMRGVNYSWKDSLALDNSTQIGFLAQEVQKVLPEVVSIDQKTGNYFMQYGPITAVLVEAVKEQQQQIESTIQENRQLRSELQSLREEIDEIKGMLAKDDTK
jgi:hypothetical protein